MFNGNATFRPVRCPDPDGTTVRDAWGQPIIHGPANMTPGGRRALAFRDPAAAAAKVRRECEQHARMHSRHVDSPCYR